MCNYTSGKCKCFGNYLPPNCTLATCPQNCSTVGGGFCNETTGRCQCYTGSNWYFVGSLCTNKYYTCVPPCVHGRCDALSGVCRCDYGWTGSTCNLLRCDGYPAECTGHGDCERTNGTCNCTAPFYGPICDKLPCFNDCIDPLHGTCDTNTGECLCVGSYYSGNNTNVDNDCRYKRCYPFDCSGHGWCNNLTGVCTCDANYGGYGCSMLNLTCPHDCSHHGSCNRTSGVCKCWTGYMGYDCSNRTCPQNCSWHGTCDHTTGLCTCDFGYTGQSCNTRTCPNDCSNHGSCNGKTGNCTCYTFSPDNSWTGIDCSQIRCWQDCNSGGYCEQGGVCNCKIGFGGTYCDKENSVLIILCTVLGSLLVIGLTTAAFLFYRHQKIKQFQKARRDRANKWSKDKTPTASADAT
eukprot:TRINITY_DN309_c0_g1_i3.p1 TRINITY_DN309_c0_g1~~TRINITY_DN309_c0_g1_i3.p1  ORF type:complete len:468 (-),score=60.89 TRINITY_DN309_c0_g1_i3:69-1286(-)